MARERRDVHCREGSTDWQSTRKHGVLGTLQYGITKSLGTQGVSPRRVKILARSCPPLWSNDRRLIFLQSHRAAPASHFSLAMKSKELAGLFIN